MGFLGSTVKTALATKAFSMLRRQASKPENQRKVKQALSRRRGSARPR